LQGQIDSLSYQLLQLKTAGIPAQQQAQVQTVIQQVVVDEDTKAEVETLKRKVGILESAVNVLQTSVMNALNTTIGLLKQLLKL
jgi:maltooligosyltrehalose synthase